MSDDLKKEDLLNAIKHGHIWHRERIEDEIKKTIYLHHSNSTRDHSFVWSKGEKINYIYENECYLLIFDGRIEVRCERENVYSSGVERSISVKNKLDINTAYELFLSMTMEAEDESEDE